MDCARCHAKISTTFSFSKDAEGMDSAKRQYALLCSHCGRPLCVQCAHQSMRNPTNREYIHFQQVCRLEPRNNRRFSVFPFFILCRDCEVKTGLADGSFMARIVDKYTRTKRYEDLAQFYEDFGMLDKAGEVRHKSREFTVKNINVDLNSLVEKLTQTGLAVPYKCRNCGASITIDKNSRPDRLRSCSYCGSAFDTESLVRLLREVLG